MISDKLKEFDKSFLDRLWIAIPKNEMKVNIKEK